MSLLSRLAVQAAKAWGFLSAQQNQVSAEYLVVAGGGGGGADDGGGGGAGGLLTSTATLSTLNTYTITVGAGGAAVVQSNPGNNGSNSSISGTGLTTITSTGGGGGACRGTNFNGKDGGSGGGGSINAGGTGVGTGGNGTSGQGNNGGISSIASPLYYGGGGGGGASAAGSNGTGSVGGAGGAGTASSISGSSVTYAGGGGGGVRTGGTAGTGGAGGGGNGALPSGTGGSGTVNTGGGGGGIGFTSANAAGAGGSGIVIISYTSATPLFVGGTITTSGGKQIHTFTSTGALTPVTPVSADFLVVAGGGGGGGKWRSGGGGGAGGLRTSAGTSGGGASAEAKVVLYSNMTYPVVVGAGGTGGAGTWSTGATAATAGSNSSISTITSTGGGLGATYTGINGGSGGSGGGGSENPTSGTGGVGTSGQGYAGGSGLSGATDGGGGGGGAGAVGGNASSVGGNGGNGVASSITGSSVTYAGGGGGGSDISANSGSSGGTGGGGGGGYYGSSLATTIAPVPGTPNTGGGGGGSGGTSTSATNGANGGSGTVIISYSGTQKFNGGVITSSGGNTIHTFNATGALTPISTTLTNSLRVQNASSQYLTRTLGSTSNRKTWTWSAWVKRGQIATTTRNLFAATDNTTASTFFGFGSYSTAPADTLFFYTEPNQKLLYTNAVFRDPSAWYHVVVSVDTTQATEANRVKLYINGTQQTVSGTYPAQNVDLQVNSTSYTHTFFSYWTNLYFYDGYIAEVNFIDGQALEPYYFGNNNDNGVWAPIKYYGTYGTNGFYLQFADGTSTTTLGTDSSGNGNNWTLTNFTRSAGVSDCWMYDVPAPASGASGTQPSSNYAVMNVLSAQSPSGVSRANLRVSYVANNNTLGNIGVSSGKYYFEATITSVGVDVGVADILQPTALNSSQYWYYNSGAKFQGGSSSAYGASYTTGDIIGVALDMNAGTVTFYKNNTSQGVAFSGLSGYFTAMARANGGGAITDFNFGQRSFAYTPPSGFVALCTANLPVATIKRGNQYMDATLYTGNGVNQTIVNAAGLSPDFVWIKDRSAANYHGLFDVIRGAGYALYSNGTFAESAFNAQTLQSFNSNGFTVGSNGDFNTNNNSYVGWQWDAGSSTVTNTSGTISSQVRASTTSGVSVVTFTGNATAGATVGHGLGVAPKMVIYKARNNGNDWWTYHAGLTSAAYAIALNTTGAQNNTVNFFNSTAPSSSVLTLGYWNNATGFNLSTQNYVAYCFAEIAGFSKFGSYTGNGSADGSFVYTGFRPKFVMVKRFDTTGEWLINDSSRDTYNPEILYLQPNLSSAEGTLNPSLDFLSNGFKFRTANANYNASGGTYIYMAFAENPFNISNAR